MIFVFKSHGPAMGEGFQSLLEIPGMHVYIYIYVQKNAHTPIYIDWDES